MRTCGRLCGPFVRTGIRWATDARCAVMLVSHPPKTSDGAGAGQVDRDYAGSTDWHGAARWRWTMDTADTGETTPGRNGGKPRPVEALASRSNLKPDMPAERGSWSVYLLCWKRYGGLQYIGISQDVDRRINAHRKAGRLPFAQLGGPAIEVLHFGLDVYAACEGRTPRDHGTPDDDAARL